jgi:hypothetical protein
MGPKQRANEESDGKQTIANVTTRAFLNKSNKST